jgi:hypothetical protein
MLHKQRRFFNHNLVCFRCWLKFAASRMRCLNLSRGECAPNKKTAVFNDLQNRVSKSLETSLIILQDTKFSVYTDLRIRHKLKVCRVGNTLDRSSSQIVNGLDICSELKQNPARALFLSINNLST